MFADTIMTDAVAAKTLGRGFAQIKGAIAASNKFILSPEFAEAADALNADSSQLGRAIPFCRLPFSHCWFEFPASARTRWLTRANGNNIHVGPTIPQSSISHTGFLVRQLDETWAINLFWSSRNYVNVNPFTVNLTHADRHGIAEDHSSGAKEFRKIRTGVIEGWAEDFLSGVVQEFGDQAETFMRDIARDWAGELSFFMSTLAVLNARNVVDKTYVDKTEHNEKRRRRGKPPLSSHYILTIHPRIAALTKAAEGDAAGSTRAHFVRGHWKARKTGLFFWSPYMRGDLLKGYVHKDYRLQTGGAQA